MNRGRATRILAWSAAAAAVCVVMALRDAAAGFVAASLSPRFRLALASEEVKYNLGYYTMWAALTPLIFCLARRVPIPRPSEAGAGRLARLRAWLPVAAFHLATGLAIAAISNTTLSVVMGALVLGRGWPPHPGDLLTPFWTRRALLAALTDTSLYWTILVAGFALRAYDEDQARKRRAADLERALVSAEVEALKMKLQPHFLFNTLNSISFLAVERNAEGVVAMVGRLAGLLRSSMGPASSQLTTVAEEMALLDQYLEIEEGRFGDRLRVVRRVEQGAAAARLPSLILQPIVENSIKHGFSRRIDASRLEITVCRDDGTLVVRVEDDGPGLPAGWDLATGCGRGLKNVIERLDRLYPGAWQFTLTNAAAGGVVTELRIPC